MSLNPCVDWLLDLSFRSLPELNVMERRGIVSYTTITLGSNNEAEYHTTLIRLLYPDSKYNACKAIQTTTQPGT